MSRRILIAFSILATLLTFGFYVLGLMNLKPTFISGFLFFTSLLITLRLLTQREPYRKSHRI